MWHRNFARGNAALAASTNFDFIDYNTFWKIYCFTFFPYKSIRDQIWPCRKIGDGQPRVIIYTNLEVLEYPMLHTKFQGHWPFGSGEGFFKVFTIYGHGGHLGHETWTSWTNFHSPIPWRPHMKLDWLAQWFLRRCLKMLTSAHTYIKHIQMTEAYLSYSLRLRWAKNCLLYPYLSTLNHPTQNIFWHFWMIKLFCHIFISRLQFC